MARKGNLLKIKQVESAKAPGRLADGNGLFLVVGKGKAKSWAFVSRKGGRWRETGLGGFPAVSLTDARAKAASLRTQLERGEDPFGRRHAAESSTFGAFIDANVDSWCERFRNPKHRQQWRNTLSDRYIETLRRVPTAEITTDDVADALRPYWKSTPETADRIRGRLEYALDAARAEKILSGDNPAAARRLLDMVLGGRPPRKPRNHPAIRWRDMPALWSRLNKLDSVSASALAFLILTAARSGEVMGATWQEIDGDAWRIPGERMKGREDHDVPLSEPAMRILDRMREFRRYNTAEGDFIFPGAKRRSKLSVMALAMCLRGVDDTGATPHGMRSTFRTWAAEETDVPREVAEQALAHAIGSKVERAYLRTRYFDKRRELMNQWAAFLESGSASAA
ncbi:MAG: site-specific integrase [Rhizobiaceae bacterium]